MELIKTTDSSRSDRRSHPRTPCEILDSNGDVIRNLSLGGAYLESHNHYSPNQRIPMVLSLPSGKTKVTFTAKVIRGEAKEGSRKVGYGLAFENLDSDVLKDLSHFLLNTTSSVNQNLHIIKGEKYRQTRYGADFLQGLKARCFLTLGDKRLEGTIQNFSKYGAAVTFQTALEWPKGGAIKDLQLLLDDREIYRGSALAKHYRSLGATYEYGFHFCEKSLDAENVFAIKEYAQIDKNLSELREKLSLCQQMKPEFKTAVGDFHYLLETLKQNLEVEEKRIHRLGNSSKAEALENECLELVDMKFRRRFEDLASIMEGIVRSLPQEEKQLYIQYCRDVLLRYLHDAPFINRAFLKPLGYPGDYETMNMIYDHKYAGATLWQKAVNHLCWGLPTNQAVRNRALYLAEKIREVVSDKPDKPKNIMSLACGPCKEIQIALTDPADSLAKSKEVSFHLIDHDPHALNYVQDVLGEINIKRPNKVSLNAYRINVSDFIKNPEIREKFPPQDLIYVSGLFDYLSDEVAELLIGIFYFMLKPDGQLVIGNFSPFNPFRLFQEFGLDWFLLYRNEKDLKKLVPKFLKCSNISVEDEPTHINLFLNLTKAPNGRSGS